MTGHAIQGRVRCWLFGHDWLPWRIDEQGGEWRYCQRCGAGEHNIQRAKATILRAEEARRDRYFAAMDRDR